jgi:hypothetical protein
MRLLMSQSAAVAGQLIGVSSPSSDVEEASRAVASAAAVWDAPETAKPSESTLFRNKTSILAVPVDRESNAGSERLISEQLEDLAKISLSLGTNMLQQHAHDVA